MPTVQDVFANDFAKGYPGMVANGETSNRISRTVEDVAGIAFGKFCFDGAGAHGTTMTPTANKTLGIAIADRGVVRLAGQTADTYQQYKTAGIMQAGVMWVKADGNIGRDTEVAVLADGSIVATGTADSVNTGWKTLAAVTAGNLVRVARRI